MNEITEFDEQAFLKLPESTRHLLEFLAVVYAPVAATPLSKLLPVAMDIKLLRPLLDDLVDDGWLTKGKNNYYRCAPAVCDDLTRYCIREGRFPAWAQRVADKLSPEAPRHSWHYRWWKQSDHALRDLRLTALQGDARKLLRLLPAAESQYVNSPRFQPHPWMTLWGETLDKAWLAYLPEAVFLQMIAPVYLQQADQDMLDVRHVWEHCSQQLRNTPMNTAALWETFGGVFYWQLFQRLQWEDALALEPPASAGAQLEYWGLFAASRALSQGKPAETIALYEAALKRRRKRTSTRKGYFEAVQEVFYVLALLLDGKDKPLQTAGRYIREYAYRYPVYGVLAFFADAQLSGKTPEMPDELINYQASPLTLLIALIVRYWLGHSIPDDWLEAAMTCYRKLDTAGYVWLAGEFAAVLAQALAENDQRQAVYQGLANTARQQADTQPLISLYRPKTEWERALEALQRIGGKASVSEKSARPGAERMVWLLDKQKYRGGVVAYFLTPKVQKLNKKGWTSGRSVALKRLATEPENFPFLSEEDRKICQSIKLYNYGYYDKSHELYVDDVWQHLIGHPRLFWPDALHSPLDVQEGQAELLILKERGKLRIKLFPDIELADAERPDRYQVVEETTLQLKVYRLTDSVLNLHSILGRKGLLVPHEAEDEVRRTLESLAPMITIQSDIGGMENATTVEVDARLHIHLLPWGEGLRLLMRVQPLGEGGPILQPGSGRSNVMAEIDGKLLKTNRKLRQERDAAEALTQNCAALSVWEDTGDDLLLDDPEQCLEALQQLHELGDAIVLSWPEGEKLRITPQVDGRNLSLKVKQSGDWFALDGKLQVDANLVLTLRQLLELSQSANGRFVPLGDGQFLTLTRQFQKRLETLQAYAENAGKQGLKVGALAGMALEDFVDEASELEADKHWKSQVSKLKKIRRSQPSVPVNLQAELRDYQEDGFRWMKRLADWGVGGCLADDMGLGKTVQTLALLLTRGDQGAALVVAPVSVCNNWYTECQRFAPDLRPVMYRGKGRQQLLESLQPNDLLIASYGLLQQDVEAFQPIRWSSIVLDEAQAIKNTNTKRTQAVYQLQGDFRLVTTGTPIENHLGELWSLFRFLNPGLLLSQTQFSRRFQTPIERDNDDKARHALKKLVQPFLLRRTKNQVLQELPPRTEISLSIALSDAERALYEALRQQALERFAEPGDEEGKHLEVLAEITRLRLAACHPQLAMPDSELPSSKLQAFGELVTELLENRHKALVFSQFVKHLALLRAWLDKHGITYQYLDGSTTPEQRQQRVEAFQRGKGDIFLISLKAGGFGLNLTAADYVIHMDPWWNPAVEDQASDRAHRIGQQRPVTIYRLVAENTIEEKIVKLHQTKRDLADSLLEGSDLSGKLSAKDMLDMIRSGA